MGNRHPFVKFDNIAAACIVNFDITMLVLGDDKDIIAVTAVIFMKRLSGAQRQHIIVTAKGFA